VLTLLSGEYPTTELLSTVNWTTVPSLLSLPCRARLNCQPSTELITSNCPGHSMDHIEKHPISNSKSIVACVFIAKEMCLQAVAQKQSYIFLSRRRCIATAVHATILCLIAISCIKSFLYYLLGRPHKTFLFILSWFSDYTCGLDWYLDLLNSTTLNYKQL
jgi:hypothetical protein